MQPRSLISAFLALFVLFGLALAVAVPAPAPHGLQKRALCGEVLPGNINTQPSLIPFLTCDQAPDVVSYFFQEDGNFVVYNGSWTPVWNSGTGGHNCTASGSNCTLAFQPDGNFVMYYNRSPLWYSGTGAGIGKALWFQNVVPYMYILNSANAQAWHT